MLLHLLCEPKIEFKSLAGGKALANDHRKIAEYIFLPVGGYFSIYFICSPTGNPPGPASELLYKQNSTKMNRTIDCFMSAWFASDSSLKVYDELISWKEKNNLSLFFSCTICHLIKPDRILYTPLTFLKLLGYFQTA